MHTSERRAARFDMRRYHTESLELAVRQQGSPAFQKLLFMLTKDIGDFQPMLAHLCL